MNSPTGLCPTCSRRAMLKASVLAAIPLTPFSTIDSLHDQSQLDAGFADGIRAGADQDEFGAGIVEEVGRIEVDKALPLEFALQRRGIFRLREGGKPARGGELASGFLTVTMMLACLRMLSCCCASRGVLGSSRAY
jgi:hypothetical protein